MKKTIVAVVLTMVAVMAVAVYPVGVNAGQVDALTVIVDGKKIDFPDAPAHIDENGRLQIPVRFIGEALGAYAFWDDKLRRVEFEKITEANDELQIENLIFFVGDKEYTYVNTTNESKNTQSMLMDTVPVIIHDRAFIPVRYVAEGLGATVSWEESSRTVVIDWRES